MGLLNAQGGGNINPAQLMQMMQMMQQQQSDPFSKSMPGDGLLNSGNSAYMPQQGPQNPQDPQMMQAPMQGADPKPGLPSLPPDFGGFGFGRYAPKEVQPMGIRQQLIQQLISQLPQLTMRGNMGGM